MARLRIEFSGADGAREKDKFLQELTDNGIGWINVGGHPTLVDFFINDLEHHNQLTLRSLLEYHSNWSGVGPICGRDEKHGATTAAYGRAIRIADNHLWKCLIGGCGWEKRVADSGYVPLMEWNNQIQRIANAFEQRKRENPLSASSISGRSVARADQIWLGALKESQRYFNKNLDQFSNTNDAMSHMRQGGQVQIPEAMLGVDYSYIEHRVLEIFHHALQTGEQIVVAMKDKVHEPMKHVLPLEYFEAKKNALRSAAKSPSFTEALGVYKPWESLQVLRKRLTELEGVSKEDRYLAIYGGMTEHEKQQRLRTNEPNPVGQIPRDPKWGEDVFDAARRRGVAVNQEKIAELERKIAIDTETHEGMVAYNPKYDLKVLEGMTLGVDYGASDHATATVLAIFPELSKNLADKIAEIEALKKTIERQDKDIDALTKNQDDKHWLGDAHIKMLDELFMFFAGLNLQDHAVAEQRKYLELMRKFKTLMLDLKEAAKIT